MLSSLYTVSDGEFCLTKTGIALCYVVVVLLIALAIFLFVKKSSSKKPVVSGVKQLVFSAAAMALGYIASEVLPTITLPMGGSITLFSMLFITLIGYWYGLGPGLSTALAYGLLQFVVDPKFISVPQVFLDYIFAFGALGLSGLFAGKKHGLLLGYLTGVVGRYFFAFLAGWLIWGIYAPEGMSPVIYSITYNATYLVPELVLTLVVLAIPAVKKGLGEVKKIACS